MTCQITLELMSTFLDFIVDTIVNGDERLVVQKLSLLAYGLIHDLDFEVMQLRPWSNAERDIEFYYV